MTANHRIFKNSLYMAVRMIVTMTITLFTSRVVLQQLGETDYGVYVVVGGLSILVAFLTSSLTAAIQRYMNVEIGQTGGRNMQKVFASCCVCVILTAIIVIILAETVGIWFLNSKLSIPADRMQDANIVYQMSLFLVMNELLRVPYSSLITAYEKMTFYAYNSILEALLKLTAVILLSCILGDKLIVYMWLLVGVSMMITASYILYSKRYFKGIYFSVRSSWIDIIDVSRFAGWNILTSISDIAYQQGSSMVLNIFYGVTFNATMGIVSQVKTAVFSFTRSVQYASNPQIIQSFIAGRHQDYVKLFVMISKLSFYLVLFIGLPLVLNMNYVLELWLGEIPPQGVLFARLMIIFCLLDSLTGPLWISMQAYGKIASYQVIISIIWIMCLPLTYIAYKQGFPPATLLVIMILINIVLIIVRLWFNKKCCNVSVKTYLMEVVSRLVGVTVVGASVPVFLSFVGLGDLKEFVITTVSSIIIIPCAIYFIGSTTTEKVAIKRWISKYFKSFK